MKGAVELRNHLRELRNFQLRLAISAGFVLVLGLSLFVRFYYLQVLQREHYHTLAEANRISIAPIIPNRGLIFDRNGEVLAHNYSAYTLEIVPSKVVDLDLETLINELSTVIEIAPRDRKRFKKLMEESKRFESLPIRTRLSDVEVARTANRYRFPEWKSRRDFSAISNRKVPTLWIYGRINDKDLEQLEAKGGLANYRGSQYMGKIGIEQSYEKELHGITGFEEMETDAAGRVIRVISRTPPISGNNLMLSLDAKLQEVAEKAFGDRRGPGGHMSLPLASRTGVRQ
jgi:penicillin-binding protein 2